ncbi:TATA-binding protein-associated factor mot1 [Dimargaris verticillata]|uniref:TATA-binding protein-associated factor mot1 n=1 Tax=Dimargaris verticillata TaxID=2761393 RepID=A0A9W8B3P9_9FUNG|nr:TATA-binding protein-associated factor mot1 [Dimargaris verticillata]
MASRLDRLILLLDTGSTQTVRATAAQQIGDIQKTHPHELANLLGRVCRYLRSKQWETRAAAGMALEAIAKHVPTWTPNLEANGADGDAKAIGAHPTTTDMDAISSITTGSPGTSRSPSPTLTAHDDTAWSFARIDLPTILAHGQTLLSSAGKEFDLDLSDLDPVERMRLQRQRLAQSLGMGMQFAAGDLVDDADLHLTTSAVNRPPTAPQPPPPTIPVATLGAAQTAAASNIPHTGHGADGAAPVPTPAGPRPRGRPRKNPLPPPQPAIPSPAAAAVQASLAHVDMSGLSARERNRLKRKAKREGKMGVTATGGSSATSTSSAMTPNHPDAAGYSHEKVRVIESQAGHTGVAVPVSRISSSNSMVGTRGGSVPPGLSVSTQDAQAEASTGPTTPTAGSDMPLAQDAPSIAPTAGGNTTASLPFAVSVDHWPFTRVVDQLCLDLFDADWEIRHGAGIGLKAILRHHGQGAARKVGCKLAENDERHQRYLLDLSVRLVCVLALDRFCDFVSDQVVTPVRETCSQTLGTVSQFLAPAGVLQVMEALLQLVHQPWTQPQPSPLHQQWAMTTPAYPSRGTPPAHPIWDVRYAGLLGLKYLVAVRQDMAEQMLSQTVGAVHIGLQDDDDDVRAVSASTLIPLVDVLVTRLPDEIPRICHVLWTGLAQLKDDLTPSIASVMELVSKLYRYEQVCTMMKQSTKATESLVVKQEEPTAIAGIGSAGLDQLVPRLYPFFRHTMTSVRLAVLDTLLTFVRLLPNDPWVDQQWQMVDDRCLRLLYQNLLLESHPRILNLSAEVWCALVWRLVRSHSKLSSAVSPTLPLVALVSPHLTAWFSWLATPIGVPLQVQGMYSAPAFSHFQPATAMAMDNGESLTGYQVHPVDSAMVQQDMGLLTHEVVYRNRVAACRALGQVMGALTFLQAQAHGWIASVSSDPNSQGVKAETALLSSAAPLADSTAMDQVWVACLDSLLVSSQAFHQWAAATVIEEWAATYTLTRALTAPQVAWSPPSTQGGLPISLVSLSSLAASFHTALLQQLQATTAGPTSGSNLPYTELQPSLRTIYQACGALLHEFTTTGRVPSTQIPTLPPLFAASTPGGAPMPQGTLFTAELGGQVATVIYTQLYSLIPGAVQTKAALSALEDRRNQVLVAVDQYHTTLSQLQVRTHGAKAGAVVMLGKLPSKLNAVIRSLMNAIKSEAIADLQLRSALSVSRLCALLLASATSPDPQANGGHLNNGNGAASTSPTAPVSVAPVDKLVKNLCTFVCSDPNITPVLQTQSQQLGVWSLQPYHDPTNSQTQPLATATYCQSTTQAVMATLEHMKLGLAPYYPKLSQSLGMVSTVSTTAAKQEPQSEVTCQGHAVTKDLPSELGVVVAPLFGNLGAALASHQGTSKHAPKSSTSSGGAAGSNGDDKSAGRGRGRGRSRGRGRGRGRGGSTKSTTDSIPDPPVQPATESPAVGGSPSNGNGSPGEGHGSLHKPTPTVRGAVMALHSLATLFGPHLFAKLPRLWHHIARPLDGIEANSDGKDATLTVHGNKGHIEDSPSGVVEQLNAQLVISTPTPAISLPSPLGQDIISAMHIIRVLIQALDPFLRDTVLSLLRPVVTVLQCEYAVLRMTAAQCLAALAEVLVNPVLTATVRWIVPSLGDMKHLTRRQGAAEAIYQLVMRLDYRILPFVIFLVVPVLGRMSDPDDQVRMACTNSFAHLIKLVPLEAGIPDPPEMAADLLAHREHERQFLAQLMDSSQLESFRIPVSIKVDLRKYQQEGVNWLAFLNRYHLHGILCDDMGLGKTLQSICILASDHFHRAEKYRQTRGADCCPLPSLVVCPPTLIGHWQQEIVTYVDTLRPLVYAGPPNDRRKLKAVFSQYDVVIMSYDVLRNDLEDLHSLQWNYCILDEGHVIKNTKTKITKAVKSVQALHRLILSGTPVQNNVLELWSLFDFLMPGFLGTERMFNERYGKPILASRDGKSSSRDQEQGALALEALHKQVLPFLLRRMKEDVLHDLPPKIIQDYYCELSDLQRQLYESFANSKTTQTIRRSLETGESYSEMDEDQPTTSHHREVVAGAESSTTGPVEKKRNQTHIFQALQYLRKLVNHPLLVLNSKQSQHNALIAKYAPNPQALRELSHAPKLLALRQLLTDCGIGVTAEPTTSSSSSSAGAAAASATSMGAVSQHRALIFCQLKTMLDIVENDLLRTHMPTVTYMRLDGSVDAQRRQDVVQKFNQDPSIDVLLLTTHVGGLGLNLTGADTVIFIEHDWNPMKDLQAMDRAHRLGQKRVVNVYRLITRGTLEEKIMGLQKFKLNVANSIINQQNAGLQSMNTDQLLDLFNVSSTPTSGPNPRGGSDGGSASKQQDARKKGSSAKAVLENLDDLWDDKQYNEEYNLDSFIQSLK